MNTNKPRSRLFYFVLGALLPTTACAVSPEETLDAPAFRSSDEGVTSGDADLDEEVDAAQHAAADAGAGRDGRDGSDRASRLEDAAELDPGADAPADGADETATDPGPARPIDTPEVELPPVRDAEASSEDASAPGVDASVAPLQPEAGLPAGMCKQATDCTQPCVPVGILQCCRDDGRCGCTWAPGAYCL